MQNSPFNSSVSFDRDNDIHNTYKHILSNINPDKNHISSPNIANQSSMDSVRTNLFEAPTNRHEYNIGENTMAKYRDLELRENLLRESLKNYDIKSKNLHSEQSILESNSEKLKQSQNKLEKVFRKLERAKRELKERAENLDIQEKEFKTKLQIQEKERSELSDQKEHFKNEKSEAQLLINNYKVIKREQTNRLEEIESKTEILTQKQRTLEGQILEQERLSEENKITKSILSNKEKLISNKERDLTEKQKNLINFENKLNNKKFELRNLEKTSSIRQKENYLKSEFQSEKHSLEEQIANLKIDLDDKQRSITEKELTINKLQTSINELQIDQKMLIDIFGSKDPSNNKEFDSLFSKIKKRSHNNDFSNYSKNSDNINYSIIEIVNSKENLLKRRETKIKSLENFVLKEKNLLKNNFRHNIENCKRLLEHIKNYKAEFVEFYKEMNSLKTQVSEKIKKLEISENSNINRISKAKKVFVENKKIENFVKEFTEKNVENLKMMASKNKEEIKFLNSLINNYKELFEILNDKKANLKNNFRMDGKIIDALVKMPVMVFWADRYSKNSFVVTVKNLLFKKDKFRAEVYKNEILNFLKVVSKVMWTKFEDFSKDAKSYWNKNIVKFDYDEFIENKRELVLERIKENKRNLDINSRMFYKINSGIEIADKEILQVVVDSSSSINKQDKILHK